MRTFFIIAAVGISAYVIYYVAQNLGKAYKRQEEAAGKLGKYKEKQKSQGIWGSFASSFIDPFGITSGVE